MGSEAIFRHRRVRPGHIDHIRYWRNITHFCLNGFRASGVVSSGRVKRLNLKARLTMKKACGFRNVETLPTGHADRWKRPRIQNHP